MWGQGTGTLLANARDTAIQRARYTRPSPEGGRKGTPLLYTNVPVQPFERVGHHQGLSGKGRKLSTVQP
jgi:hypothetical protein